MNGMRANAATQQAWESVWNAWSAVVADDEDDITSDLVERVVAQVKASLPEGARFKRSRAWVKQVLSEPEETSPWADGVLVGRAMRFDPAAIEALRPADRRSFYKRLAGMAEPYGETVDSWTSGPAPFKNFWSEPMKFEPTGRRAAWLELPELAREAIRKGVTSVRRAAEASTA